jgi:hypothetical protein
MDGDGTALPLLSAVVPGQEGRRAVGNVQPCWRLLQLGKGRWIASSKRGRVRSGRFEDISLSGHQVRTQVRVICSVGFSSGQGRVFRYHSGAAVAAYALFCSQRRRRCWLARSIAIANKSFLGALGFLAEGQGAPGSPAHPAVDPRPPARHSARREQPAGRATGHQGSPSADGLACRRSPPGALLPGAA